MPFVPLARNARALLAAALCLLGVAHLLYHAQYTLDDAYITFRYARNLVRGLGLVYNPGAYVKGYSNTLYTLATGLPEWFGRDPITFSKVLGVAAFCTICALGYRFYAAEESAEVRDRGVWFVALCAASTPLAVHSMNGLETGSYTALVFAAVLARLREQRTAGAPWSAALFCAVVWSRPEGIALFLAMAIHDAALRAHRRAISARDLVFYAAPLLAYAGELGLSLLYYGDALPQTYHAKARPAAGLLGFAEALWHGLLKQASPESYLVRGLELAGGWGVLLLVPLCLLSRARFRIHAALVLVLLAQLAFILRANNDWAPAFRFGVPALPLLFLLVLESIAAAAALMPALHRLSFSVLSAMWLALALPVNVSEAREIEAKRYVNATGKLAEGARLAELAEPGITLASFDIGGHGYAAGGFDILDTAGLTARPMTGCFGQKSERCKRYVALIRPELIRRHPSGKDSGLTTNPARASGLYLDLDEKRYAILAALVLLPALPEHAQALAQNAAGDLVLAGSDLPEVVVKATQSVLTLFWKRARTDSAPAARQLRWQLGNATSSATATPALWTRMQQPERWTADQLFADRVVIQTPTRAGRYTLWATVQGAALRIGEIDVVERSEAPARARALAREADALRTSGRLLAATARLERAVRLDADDSVRDAYQALVVTRARRMDGEAERARAGDHETALRVLREAKTLLHRAFWQSGRAGAELRAEIDKNARQLDALVSDDLAQLPAKSRD